jgi:Zn-dependent protease
VFRFRIGPFPVTVHVSFLFAAVLVGSYGLTEARDNLMFALQDVVLWVFVVFVSVLVHELGHALVGVAFGGRPEIELEGFGGVTFPKLPRRPGAGRQLLLSVAGPVAGLALGGVALALTAWLSPPPRSIARVVLSRFWWTSLYWAILNLVPVLPLDGGQMLMAGLEGIRKKPSVRLASWISAAIALAIALAAVTRSAPLIAVFFALFAFQNFARARLAEPGQAPRPPRAAQPDPVPPQDRADVDRELARARSALLASDEQTALAAAAALEESEAPYRQAAGLRIRAGVELARGDFASAGLHAGRSFTLWQSPDAAVVAARANLRAGEQDRARNWLRRAVEAGAAPAAVRDDPELGPLAN